MSLEAEFRRHLPSLSLRPGPGLVAVSGGADSLALLHLLFRTRDAHPLDLRVVHVDHGIQPESGAVADRVAALAVTLGLPCAVGRLKLGPQASETAAREARYAWLRDQLERAPGGVLLTAHHRDDQIETVLMRVLRGSGPAGLAGMPPVAGRVVRPLLKFGRAELHAYLGSLGQQAWEDPANLSPRHLRSWIRTSLLPAIRTRLVDVDRALLSVAAQARADREAWEALLDVLPLELRAWPGGVSVVSAVLRGYDSQLSLGLIRALARKAGCQVGQQQAERVLRLVQRGHSGRGIELGGGWVAQLSFGRLELVRRTVTPVANQEAPFVGAPAAGGSGGEATLGRWAFRWRHETAPLTLAREAMTSWFVPGEYQVRWWRPGDRIRPLGARGRRLVVRCMQDRRVRREDRATWPVLTHGGEIVWVPGVMRGAGRVPAPGGEAVRIDAERT